MVTLDLFNATAAKGLFYPPDPGSQKISTLGGNVMEDAGGLRGLKYGVTRDYVMALKCVLPDGSILTTGGKSVKDVAGYAFKDLLVGSEGTLGIITEVTVKLIPPPQAKRTFLAYFDDIRTAGAAVSKIIAAKIIPSTMEIMDRATINCVEDYVKIGLPRQMAALLLIEVDGHPAMVAEEARRGRGDPQGGQGRRNSRRQGRRGGRPAWPPPGAPPFRRWPGSRRPPCWKTPPCRARCSPRPSPRSSG